MKNIKIHDSKGKLHLVCPYIEKVLEVVIKYKIDPADMLEIQLHLNTIREIAKAWQGESCIDIKNKTSKQIQAELDNSSIANRIAKPYNYGAVLSRIKAKLPQHAEIIDEIINTYN